MNEVNRALSDALQKFRESVQSIAGMDDSGDLNIAHVSDAGALLVALENLDIGVDIQVEPLEYMFQNLDEAGDPQYYGYVRADGK